jgi:hypothetical protein
MRMDLEAGIPRVHLARLDANFGLMIDVRR